jgi:cell fate regulator YaaT (PSP1 superfamily)
MEINQQTLPKIVGIKFSKIGKNYYFDASKIPEIKIGDSLIVETSRGWQIGELAEIITNPEVLKNASYKPVDRMATPADLIKKEELRKKGEKALEICRTEIRRQNYAGIKLISSEISFDELILSFLFSCESEESPNFNNIKKVLGREFPKARIDFHKIGPRDVARYFGGIGSCGLENRCCSQFLCNFEAISIRMAKKQGISLTPTDITGMCDRLRCCLSYEYCQYVEALQDMPKKNKMVNTPSGRGKITDVSPLRNTVYVFIEEIGIKEFPVSEIQDVVLSKEEGEGKGENQPKPDHHRENPGNRRNSRQ